MPTENKTSSSIPPHAVECLSQFLALVDGACKRYSVDIYNAQMANIRNHLWLAFVVLSACAAFFVQAGIGDLLVRYFHSPEFDLLTLSTVFLLLFSVINAALALLSGIEASTGTTITEAYRSINQQLTTFENRGFLVDDVYDLKLTVLFDVHSQMMAAADQMIRRGKLIRSMSKRIKRSVLFGIAAVLSFLISQPFYG